MASYVKYEVFAEDLMNKLHDLFGTTDTLKVAICSDAPVVATDDEMADRTQVTGTGYTALGEDTQNDSTRTGGTVTLTGVDAGMVIPPRYYERNLEQNQGLASCCRHPEEMEISAYRSKAHEDPDIYKFHCSCGKTHVRFMCGGNKVQHMPDGSVEIIERDVRIAWDVR
jgi:hypothetical protein